MNKRWLNDIIWFCLKRIRPLTGAEGYTGILNNKTLPEFKISILSKTGIS